MDGQRRKSHSLHGIGNSAVLASVVTRKVRRSQTLGVTNIPDDSFNAAQGLFDSWINFAYPHFNRHTIHHECARYFGCWSLQGKDPRFLLVYTEHIISGLVIYNSNRLVGGCDRCWWYRGPSCCARACCVAQGAQRGCELDHPGFIIAVLLTLFPIDRPFKSLGAEVIHNPYHVPLARMQLNRALPKLLPEICDEIDQAFKRSWIISYRGYPVITRVSHLDLDWTGIKALNISIARAMNRILVGLPLCMLFSDI